MNDTSLKLMQLGAQGFCCSQMMVLMALQDQGEENTALVRAMSGLCHGVGESGGICGAVTGGACVLGLYAGKGNETEEEHDHYKLMVSELMDWFTELATADYGGPTCNDITNDSGVPDMGICGLLVEKTREKVLEILTENGIDPTLPKENSNAY